uniref:Sidekick cell adhesion molecule 2 n=1 Tax=Eptatretus burgeri TaxID=7764 RepID=A0A8C4QIJ2_EPTBU
MTLKLPLFPRRTDLGDFEEVGERTLSVERGEAIIIDPPQIGSYPQPQVTWFREGRKVSPTSRIVVTLSNQLVVMLVGSGDAGTYHAQVMNERNGETKTGPPIVLTVRESESNVHSSTPDVVVTPRNASVVAGAAEVSFECIPFVRPLRQFSIVWKRNGAPVTSSLSDHDRRLKLVNPSPEDAGRYDCEVWLTGSGRPPLIRTAYLSVSEVPQFAKEPEKRIPGIVGSELDIPCQASGLPVPSVTWYHDGLPVGLASIDGRYQVLPHGSLRIHRLEEKDSGMLQCFAKNSAGEVQTHAHLTVRSFPPNITQGPVDSTVIEGSSVSLLCETSGAPKPTITWLRGGKPLSPGSPRFSVTSSGSLHLNPAELRDSGTYTCRAKNYRGEALARANLVVWVRTRIVIPPRDQNVVKGMTVALHCGVTHDPVVPVRFDWEKDGVAVEPELVPRYSLDSDGSLHITRTWSADIGIYNCHVRSTAGNDSKSARVDVREAPHAPRSVSARLGSSEARSIDISWLSGYDGNTPLLRYILEASENGSPWIILRSDVAPALTNLTLRGLAPAQSYHFRLTGVNGVGAGEPSSETDRTVLPEEPPDASPLNLLASGQTNQTIALLWQPPPEIQWNGVLKGYLIRYRLSGLPSDYLYKNVPNPDVMSFRLEDLNVWTSYDVEIAAYNAAGLGPYCAAVTERTHEGVPKAAPERMQAQAVNSTTLRLRWYPPRRSLIYGIVQGYKLLAWRSETPKEVMVRILPPPSPATQPGPVKGLITGLKKFTEYYVSVLCFTTPGDGPRSPPLRLHTAEDVPGPVGNLRFSEILDTSLKIIWEEPRDKNGILFGYKVSWVEFNKTHNRVTHNLSNSTLEYRVTGLAALTTYVIEISARTTVGSGPVTATSISSGIPPELPGAPSNLIVSNIAARSVLLQFRAGFDGKTSILKWVVEAQKETGESAEEDWETIYEQKNNPSARSLEVPNLVPFTNYRFRLRQTNIMGTSPPSKATRHVKTSPAAPDYAPTSIMVRTASETSLWVRWAPLQENDFNAPASSLGYRVRCRRANRLTTPPLILTVDDVSEREVTVQGLRPWADYEIFVQAYNRMGSGPWAGPVTGHTSESVPSNGPDNLTANATSPTTVLITWGQVSEDERNGLILGYKVWFREEGARNDFVHKIVRGNHSRSFLLAALRRYTPYEIQLQAYTRAGDGARSPPVYVRTLDSVPGPPFALYFPDVQLTSVRLAWQPPTEPNGVILGYKVAHWLDSGDSHSSPLAEVKPEARHFFAGGLIPNSIYHFRVTARTRKGWGETAEVIVVNTESRDHPDAPSKLAIPKLWVGSRSVTMSWDPGNDHSAPLRHYILQARSLPDGHWFTHSPWVPPHLTTYTADRLKPFTAYIFRLAAQNDVGQSHWSEASPAVVTLQAAPEKPPSIISIVPRTTSSVLVKWEPPAEDYVNGVLLGYHVLYRELSLGSHQQPALPPNHAVTPRIPSPIQAQLLAKYNVRTVNNSAATDYELARLTKFRQYEICIRAYTVAGDGPTTVPLQVYVGEAGWCRFSTFNILLCISKTGMSWNNLFR